MLYLSIYTFTDLANKVILEFNKFKKENNESLNIKSALAKVLKAEKLKDVFKLYDKRNLVLYLYNIINKDNITPEEKKEIYMFSIAFPDAVLASMFVKVYHDNKILIKKN